MKRNHTVITRAGRRLAMVLLTGGAVAGMAGASAATLGGATSGSLGSDDAVVASCDTDGITINYTTAYNAASQKYLVSTVNFTSVNAACNGKAASVSLRTGATLLTTQAAASITVASGAFSIALATPVAAGSIDGASLIISG